MIELRSLRKEFDGVAALSDISLTVPAGEIHGIVGRSGAGKSTLIRCLTGLEKPTSGTVVVDGVEISARRGEDLRRARRNIGMVFQHANLLDSRTALKNVELPLEIAGVSARARRERARELLNLVGLADRADNHPAQLSGGQQQRVGIARALAAEPTILLCDEPTSALDTETTRQILDLIRGLRDRLGITVLIITHEMSVVREVCDSVTLLDSGRVARTGALLDLIRDTSSPLGRELLPLPQRGADGGTVVEALLTETPLTRLLEVLAPRGESVRVDAGAVETISGSHVGRLQLSADSPGDAAEIVADLRTAGIFAEVTS